MTQIKGFVSGTVALLLSGTAFGASSVTVNIERQGMAGALNEFAKQSGMQLLYPSNGELEQLMAKEVVGTYPAEIALSQLLEDSGLRYQFVNARTVAIEANGDSSEDHPQTTGSVHSREQVASAEASHSVQAESEATSELAGNPQGERRGIPEILVRGSRSLNADIERTPDDIQPYVVFTRSAIERSGASNVEQFLRKQLTMNYVPVASDEQGTAGIGAQSEVALRGLSRRETLILIDGRRPGGRLVGPATFQPDLNTLPLDAIERIEVLPATGSGIYGSNATGGVINVVLRRDYSGVATAITYELTAEGGGTSRRVELNGGFSLGANTSLSFHGSFSDQEALFAKDRDFVADYTRQARQNAGSEVVPLGYTTNIQSSLVNGIRPNLTLKPIYGGHSLNSPIAFVPPGYAGVGSDGGLGLLQGAGSFNTHFSETAQIGGGMVSLVSPNTVRSISATLRHRISDRWEAFMELAGSSSQSAYRLHAITGTFFIPASAPSNPFEQDITVNVPITGGHDTYDSRSGSYRALLGAVLEVGRSWRAEFDVTFDRNDMRQAFPSGRLLSSANSAVLTGAIDVFKDINAFPVDFASHMPPASSISPTHSTQRGAAARFSGPFFDLPGGSATLSVVLEGFENEYGDFEQVTYGLGGVPTRLLYSGRSSSNGSTYLEVRLPLVSESNRIRGMDLLELQLAGRYDHYELKAGSLTRDGSDDSPSHVGFREDSVEPTVGVRFRPFLGLTFRASYATGFVPPDIVHLMPLLSSTQIGFFLTDPKRGDEFLGNVVVHRGGRNDIKPERSISKSAGMIIAPPWLPGLRVSFDWTKIEKRDNIISLGLDQDTINNEDRLPGVIIRELPPPGDPYGVGRIVELDGRYRNGTWAKSESYDFSIEYEYPTEGLGTWTFHGAATKLLHSVQQAVPFFPPTEYAGTFAAPEWSANATLAWNRGPLGASWTTRYLDDYWLFTNHEHYAAQGGAKVGAATYHDIAVRYQTGEESKATLFSNISVRAGIRNVLNRKPRFYAVSSTMYDPWSDPRMATYYVTISKRF